MKSAVGLLCLSSLFVGTGCIAGWGSRLSLPAGHTLVREQLVIHSDFPLASQHRLLEELSARRLDLTQRLGLPTSDEPIDVYLFESAERFHAFVRLYHPEFPSRRAFFLETDTRLMVYAQWGDRVAEDLRHEVTHGYLHSVVPNLPLWLDEGLAEFSEVSRGARGLHRQHLAEFAELLRQGPWQPDLTRLESFDPAYDMTQLDYAEAWAWVHFLLETPNESLEILPAYLHDLRRYGSAEPVSVRLRQVYPNPERALLEHIGRLCESQDQGRQPIGG